jgi:hypothetical protein
VLSLPLNRQISSKNTGRHRNDWFCEDYNACDADQDDSAGDNDDCDDNATDSDDEQVFCLGD